MDTICPHPSSRGPAIDRLRDVRTIRFAVLGDDNFPVPAGRSGTKHLKVGRRHWRMETRQNHPDAVTLDLLADAVIRLEWLLSRLAVQADDFRRGLHGGLRADPPQDSRRSASHSRGEVNTTNPAIKQAIAAAQISPDHRSIHQLLLELHQLHEQLGKIIELLEDRHQLK